MNYRSSLSSTRQKKLLAWFWLPALLLAAGGLQAATKLMVTSPKGGEAYVIGQDQPLTFGGRGKGTGMKVEVSRDNGKTWVEVGTINTRDRDRTKRNRFVWMVSGPPSSVCLIRMTSVILPGKRTPKP